MEIVSIKEGNKTQFFKKFRILFTEISVKMKEKEIYDYRFSKEIIPRITGMTVTRYLLEKATYHKKNKSSDFGKKVILKVNKFDFNGKQEYVPNIDKNIYLGNVFLQADLLDQNNRKILSMETVFASSSLYEPTKEFYENLFTYAFSGIYASPRNEEIVINFIEGNKEINYRCSACDEEFANLNELYSHIIENKHYDLILDEFPYDEEVIRIKQLISTENE